MKIGISVYSQTGNTNAAAEKIKKKLIAGGEKVIDKVKKGLEVMQPLRYL